MSLSALTIDDNKIMDLSPLKSLDNLTHLSVTGLPDNSQFTPINDLAYLSKADVSSKILGMISDSQTITDLTIRGHSDVDLTTISQLNNLTSLTIDGNHARLLNEEELKLLPQLKTLKLVDVKSSAKTESGMPLLNLPQLEELKLGERVSLAIDLEEEIWHPKLQVLMIANPEYLALYKGEEKLKFDEVGLNSLVANFNLPQLERLSLPSANLNNLDFVKSLLNLKQLDVSDNYITEAGPLTSLPQIESVNLRNNPIENWEILSDSLHILK